MCMSFLIVVCSAKCSNGIKWERGLGRKIVCERVMPRVFVGKLP